MRGDKKCQRCGVRKPYEDFPRGKVGQNDQRRRLSTLCKDCWTERQAERDLWPVAGRRCPRCDELKSCPDEISLANNATCKSCQRKRHAEKQRERRRQTDPEIQREANRRWRQNNPQSAYESQRRYREKIMSDPQRALEWRENNRIYHKIWRMSKGINVRMPDLDEISREGTEVPVGPLLQAIENLRKRRGVKAEVGSNDSEFEAFCESLGVSDRTIRRWRDEGQMMVRMATVDRVLTNTGWHWWDVWEPDDPGYEKVRREFEGDEELVA
jgi:hypothetical protein